MIVKYRLTAPLSHIGEVSSTGSIFQTALTAHGRMPVITGNSIRGTLRDCGAKHLLDTLGIAVDKATFHVLFSGGNLSGASKLDIKRAKEAREHFPFVSLFGSGLGTMILGGKMDCGFAYPVCAESEELLGIESDGTSWRSKIDEMEFTRMDDSKDDRLSNYITDVTEESKSKASTQMRYSVQYISPGTEFVQHIALYRNTTDLELGALYTCFAEWFRHPKLGGMGNKGFGAFSGEVICDDGKTLMQTSYNNDIYIDDGVLDLINKYTEVVRECGEFLPLLSGGK